MSTTTTTTTLTQVLSSDPPASEPQYYGKLRYIPQGQTPTPSPHNFHLPAMAEFGDVRLQPLIDMRPVPTIAELPKAKEGAAQLDTHASPPSQLYVPETEEMVKQVTGAKTVITELCCSAAPSEQLPQEKSQEEKDLELGFPQFIGFSKQHGGASPAPKVHLDYAPNGARTHLRKYHPTMTATAQPIIDAEEKLLAQGKSLREDYAESGLGPRWALYSIWRPLKRVRRDPLALGDARTFLESDYVPVIVKTPNLGISPDSKDTHDTESYLARWSSGQKWYFISQQEPEEVLVIGLFDSNRDKETVAAGGTLHSSVDLPGTEDEEPRESLELRCLAIW
ncbi:hypothetical protein CLAIMM_06479 [Cladophialophora immunda]|nr:hypothetical protein CLAIMM_06479 [Cladophialophora immunda]